MTGILSETWSKEDEKNLNYPSQIRIRILLDADMDIKTFYPLGYKSRYW